VNKKNLNAKIANFFLELPTLDDECELFAIEDDRNVYRQGMVKVNTENEINVSFSFPHLSDSENVYVIASEGEPSLVRRLIANIQQLDNDSDVKLGNIQIFNSADLESIGIVGVILLPIEVSNLLCDLPDRFEYDCKDYKFLLVVPLSTKEHEVWKSDGHDALMDFFEETNKDLISFGTVTN